MGGVIQGIFRIRVATDLDAVTRTHLKLAKVLGSVDIEVGRRPVGHRNHHIVGQRRIRIFNGIGKGETDTHDFTGLWGNDSTDIKGVRRGADGLSVGTAEFNRHFLEGGEGCGVVFFLALEVFGNHGEKALAASALGGGVGQPLSVVLKDTEAAVEKVIRSVVVVFQFRHTDGDIGKIQDVVLVGGIGRCAATCTKDGDIHVLTRQDGLDELNADNVFELVLRGQVNPEALSVGGRVKLYRELIAILLVVS